MKYCKECGNKLDESSKFCDKCGKPINSEIKAIDSKETGESSKITPLTISTNKLIFLSVLSFGLYEIYWFYRQWKALKEIKDLKITAWARGLFAPLFAYPLFKQFFELARHETKKDYSSAGWLATGYFILNLLWKLEDPYWLISFTSILTLIPVQKAINEYWLSKHPNHKVSSDYKGFETAVLIIGGIFMILVIIGLFSGDQY